MIITKTRNRILPENTSSDEFLSENLKVLSYRSYNLMQEFLQTNEPENDLVSQYSESEPFDIGQDYQADADADTSTQDAFGFCGWYFDLTEMYDAGWVFVLFFIVFVKRVNDFELEVAIFLLLSSFSKLLGLRKARARENFSSATTLPQGSIFDFCPLIEWSLFAGNPRS